MEIYREKFLKILLEKDKREDHIKSFQELVWDLDEDSELINFLKELAYDLDYYEPAVELRRDEETYYGDDRLEDEIDEALDKLKSFSCN